MEVGTNDLKKLIGGEFDLRKKAFSTVPEFFGFTTWEEVVECSCWRCQAGFRLRMG